MVARKTRMIFGDRTSEEEDIARRIEDEKNLKEREREEGKVEVDKAATLWTPVFQQYVATMAKKLGVGFRVGWMENPRFDTARSTTVNSVITGPPSRNELEYEWLFTFVLSDDCEVATIIFHLKYRNPYVVLQCGDNRLREISPYSRSYKISSKEDLEALTSTLFEILYGIVVKGPR